MPQTAEAHLQGCPNIYENLFLKLDFPMKVIIEIKILSKVSIKFS